LSHDALNSDVADHLEDDLLLHSPVDSDSTIVSADLQNTLRFGEVQKVVAKKPFFYRLVRQFVLTVKNGKRVAGRLQYMPAWWTVLSKEQIYQIGAYLETLALPEANWKEPPKSP
jgi:hypothetical protein